MSGAYRCVYFYHGDHLGSSNYITDRTGRVFEHTLYLPYGETWIDEGHETSLLGYKFTGKELDEETGLYYFGARYYDAKFSNWISTDPALPEYLPTGLQLFFPEQAFNANSLKGSGGVFNSANINLYHYAGLNPVKFVDPNGKATLQIGFANDAYAIGGLSLENGIVFGYSSDKGFEFGTYKANSLQMENGMPGEVKHSDIGVSSGLNVTFSMHTKGIDKLNGDSSSDGVSMDAGAFLPSSISIGGATNTPKTGNGPSTSSVSVSLSSSVSPLDISHKDTKTEVTNKTEAVKSKYEQVKSWVKSFFE